MFSHLAVADSLQPHRLQQARFPCPSLSPGVCSNSYPLSHLILCRNPPLFLFPSIFPSIRVFSNELALCIRWPKYWSFSFSISLFNEYSELISFRIDWFDQKRVFAITSVFSWQNSVTFLYSKAKLAYYSRYLLTA